MDLDEAPSTTYLGALGWARAQEVMSGGRILPAGRTTDDLLAAVAETIARYEVRWTSPHEATAFADMFVLAMQAGRMTLGTPALSNVWSGTRPMASCAAVPVASRMLSGQHPGAAAEPYYADNMGSGYNLDEVEQPIDTLVALDAHAASVQGSRSCERYVGNMAHMSVGHPDLVDFIRLKRTMSLPHFNLSVNFSTDQVERLIAGDDEMEQILDEISQAAWACGDPGIICLDRFNQNNPLRHQSPYTTTAPCAEVGLAPGDTCVFGYVNLAAFATTTSVAGYDLPALATTVADLTRALDDLLDAGELHLANPLSRTLTASKRRIGISVCGYADLLLWLGLDYCSPEAVLLLEDLLSVVASESVRASIDLAKRRGTFGSFPVSGWAAGHPQLPPPSRLVTTEDWSRLYSEARGGLRNSALTALPPSGRSSILLGVNPSIEPFLTDPRTTALNPTLRRHAWTQAASTALTATEIPWSSHLAVVQAAASLVDESVSKTVNLHPAATVEDVRSVLRGFLKAGLKAVSVYRPLE